MLLVSVLSSVAIVVGIGANLPQIARMHRSRSAAGQSPLGWVMGGVTNLCLAYVNLVGLGATLLGVANLGSVILCSIAVALTVRFGAAGQAADSTAAASAEPVCVTSVVASSHDRMVDMPTQEFSLLHDAVRTAEQRRVARREEQRAATSTADVESERPLELALAS